MWSILVPAAFAAGLDADGSGLPVHDGSPTGGGLTQTAPQGAPGSIALGLQNSLSTGALVQNSPDGSEQRLVGTAVGSHVQVATAPTTWLAATAALPLRWGANSDTQSGGTSLGDARLSAWLRPHSAFGLGVGAAIPTGSAAQYTGSGRLVPRGLASVDMPILNRFSAQLGAFMQSEGQSDPIGGVGGWVAGGGARLVAKLPTVSIGAGVHGERPLDSAIRDRRGSPASLGLDTTWFASERLRVTGHGSRALTQGVGAPAWRIGAGLVMEFGTLTSPPEAIVPEPRRLRVTSPDGGAVAGATVLLPDGAELVTDANGTVDAPHRTALTVSAPGLKSYDVDRISTIVALDWAPVPLTLTVASMDGTALQPTITLKGPVGTSIANTPQSTTSLLPGQWELTVAAEGYGRQKRSIAVLPRSRTVIDIEVVLLPIQGNAVLDVNLTDPQGNGIRGAELSLDGVGIGTAGSGTVNVEGLEEGALAVQVTSRLFQDQTADVDLSSGRGDVDVELYYTPGTVRVTAVGPNGPVTDGIVFVDGPRSLPSLQLGDRGEALLQLTDGTWTLALSSPALGLQERTLIVSTDSPVPLEASFSLLPIQGGEGSLWVDVRDLSGGPVEGAEVWVGASSVGHTASGGSLRLEGLAPGPITVGVQGEGLVPTERAVMVTDRIEAVTLAVSWQPGTIDVSATDPAGPADALVAFAGPSAYAGGPLGAPGRRTFLELPNGEWEVMATHPSGMEVAWATIGAQPGHKTNVAIHLGDETGDGILELRVLDPLGQPVEGAEVFVDGRALVQTASGGRVRVRGLFVGTRNIEIRHPHHGSHITDVDVTNEANVATCTLPWRSGLYDLTVDAPTAITDGMLYLSGPDRHSGIPVSTTTTTRLALAPGPWDLVVSSSAGMASLTLEVPTSASPPRPVTLALGRRSNMVVHVVDHRGVAIRDVPLQLDGVEVATTDGSGRAVMAIPTEHASILPMHPSYTPVASADVGPDTKELWFELSPLPRPVPIQIIHNGRDVPATISAFGPGRIAPVTLPGTGVIDLPPGSWELVADPGEGLAAMRRFVEVLAHGDADRVRFELARARVRATATGLQLIDVRFGTAEDVASTEYESVLEEVAASIIADPAIRRVEVQGHTDPTGGVVYNYELSRRRAQSVVDALIHLGVPPQMLDARGFGPSRPIGSNEAEEGRSLNRRVDFRTLLASEDERAAR